MEGGITTKMESAFMDLNNEFSIYYRKDFENKINALEKAGGKSNRPSILSGLYDMLDVCGIEYERDRDSTYYRKLVAESNISDFPDMESKILYALYNKYKEYPSPEDYMLRIVNRMASDEDLWETDTLRVRILKQFIKYGNYLSDAGFGGKNAVRKYVKAKIRRNPLDDEEILLHLDDAVFDVLDSATKHQRRPNGKYGLLKLVDDLAFGKFRAGGATKKGLYLFAMVYGMTWHCERTDKISYESDIEKNLFEDYYTNNLIKFISKDYRENLSEFELDPCGQGINEKNFAEMVYLYFICKDCPPQDKIKKSSEMIQKVQTNARLLARPEEISARKDTSFFKGLLNGDILSSSEKEFEQFLYKNYNCNTCIGTESTERNIGVLQLETEQNTAFKNYKSILDYFKKDLGVAMEEECNYGLWFEDIDTFREEKFRQEKYKDICEKGYDVDRKKFDAFMDVLLGANHFLKNRAFVSTPDAITRTSMISAYYYYYNAIHDDENDDEYRNFREMFADFSQGVDEFLINSYYQPLSKRNLFDVLIVFSSYARLST